MGGLKFIQLAQVCEELQGIRERNKKIEKIVQFLKNLNEEEVSAGIVLLLGKPFSHPELKSFLGEATLYQLFGNEEFWRILKEKGDFGEAVYEVRSQRYPHPPSSFTVGEIYEALKEIARIEGESSQKRKKERLLELISLLSPLEVKYLIKNLIGEMRHGVKEGLIKEALLRIGKVKREEVEELILQGKPLEEIAGLVLHHPENLKEHKFTLFTPFYPMLADTAHSLSEAFQYHQGKVFVEYKLDGVRVQVHKGEGEVRIFSRHRKEVTPYLPEIIHKIEKVDSVFVVEGEVIGKGIEGKPLPFQQLMRRFQEKKSVLRIAQEIPVELYLFDILMLEGKPLFKEPYWKRREILSQLNLPFPLASSVKIKSVEEGERLLEESIKEGHEGLMVKKWDSPYIPGIRGKLWLKVKPTLTLDLVIISAEWGHGRRRRWLSDFQLGVRTEEGKFLPVGKTFKGLSDKEFEEITATLLSLKIKEEGGKVIVKPKVVVEVSFNEIQKSPHYPSGFALRFARIERIREDKIPEEADTLETLKKLYHQQFRYKGRIEERVQGYLFPSEGLESGNS